MALQTILRGKKELGLQKQVQTGLFILFSGYGVDDGLGGALDFLGVGGVYHAPAAHKHDPIHQLHPLLARFTHINSNAAAMPHNTAVYVRV